MKRFIRTALLVIPCLFGFAGIGHAQFVPAEYRIKIDRVDISKAPDIQIRATFLDKEAYPIPPKKLAYMNVYSDDDFVSAVQPEKISTLKDSDVPLDLALVLPISDRYTEKELNEMTSGITNILKQMRDNDRVAGYFADGRGINAVPLGKADAVAEQLKAATPKGQPSFLYSSLEKALDELSIAADQRRDARRAIILVTDTYDSYIFRKEDVQKEMIDIFHQARANDISIYVVMYKPFIRQLVPVFEGLSRKTGGTYRSTDHASKIFENINFAWGEVYGELFIEFTHPRLHVDELVKYRLETKHSTTGLEAKSEFYKELKIEKLQFNWKLFWIVTGTIIGILIIALIVFLLVRRHKKKVEEEEAARAEQEIQEKIERGEVCPKCRRTMMKDWKECMFCAREAAEEITKQKAENRAKAIEEAKQKGQNAEGRVCPKCNRVMMPQWKECLFCKAGIGSDAAPKKGVAPMPDKKKKKEETGERLCPVCKRPMKPHWTTCLYCEADAANRPATAAPEKKEKEAAAPAARICPDCGRPMKAHWDVCLYCEANKAKG
ncbi:MAG: VWA domain-containing protein [Proteobacteria bacterium]|nr:VWA domain-containing protein [Pseudomonadota bacterium]